MEVRPCGAWIAIAKAGLHFAIRLEPICRRLKVRTKALLLGCRARPKRARGRVVTALLPKLRMTIYAQKSCTDDECFVPQISKLAN